MNFGAILFYLKSLLLIVLQLLFLSIHRKLKTVKIKLFILTFDSTILKNRNNILRKHSN
jgi:hypothetical protein